ncbi:nuclear transport factor 2 family protein [Nocardioides sp. R-C-SC26]|uniref:nuclear transport factor 2 family protein n=1 Tax=Nocardioides sp. R-C-SC26 TaxID=2870414 RepID=UPI001E573305|nr:nuclear transport factor 2 family protein [Nocardioides sp. R-C-SC26]
MTIDNDRAIATVRQYLDLVATGTAAEITALFAPDATLEDPVGSEVRSGIEAISAFYETVAPLEATTELLTVRACGGEATFHFRMITKAGDANLTLEPMEHMVFDDEGRIQAMRAWWSDADMTWS